MPAPSLDGWLIGAPRRPLVVTPAGGRVAQAIGARTGPHCWWLARRCADAHLFAGHLLGLLVAGQFLGALGVALILALQPDLRAHA